MLDNLHVCARPAVDRVFEHGCVYPRDSVARSTAGHCFKKLSPALYGSLGVYLALITTNCAVLGTANSVISQGLDFFQTLLTGLSIGIGFTVALILMAGIREKQELYDVPKPFRGFPIALVTAGIMAMAFLRLFGAVVHLIRGEKRLWK